MWGVDPASGKVRTWSANKFQFPACKKCNEKYSNLESATKNVVASMSQGANLTPNQAVALLDWMDKVRIGMWLGINSLDGDLVKKPKFFINQRIASKDRFLHICRVPNGEGFTAFGSITPLFKVMPSGFAIAMKNLILINGSVDFFCGRQCGHPFPTQFKQEGISRIYFDFANGTGKISTPILPFELITPGVTIYQSVLERGQDDSRLMRSTWKTHSKLDLVIEHTDHDPFYVPIDSTEPTIEIPMSEYPPGDVGAWTFLDVLELQAQFLKYDVLITGRRIGEIEFLLVEANQYLAQPIYSDPNIRNLLRDKNRIFQPGASFIL